MRRDFYVPILKSKDGEFTALSKLRRKEKALIVPLFEITPMEWDHAERKVPRTLDDHLNAFCKKVVKKWGNENCFVDTGLLNWQGQDNTPSIDLIFDKLASNNIVPKPVIHLFPSERFIVAFNETVNKHAIEEIAIRVTPGNVVSPDFESDVNNILDRIQFDPEQCHLVFDLKESDFTKVDEFAESILAIFESFPYFERWKSFSIVGTSFPTSRNIKEGLSEWSRNEWKLYNRVVERLSIESYDREINYGDYSIVSPEYFEFNPRTMSSSATIKYTHNEKWIVAKGKALKDSAAYKQYRKLAKQIRDSEFYLGEDYSEGDLHLAKCVREETSPGSPNVWIWVGNNHHFTKVIRDLTSITLAS